eukprot:403365826
MEQIMKEYGLQLISQKDPSTFKNIQFGNKDTKLITFHRGQQDVHSGDREKSSSVMANLSNSDQIDKKNPFFNRKLKNEKMIQLDEKSLLKLGQITEDELTYKEKEQVSSENLGLERAKQYFQKKLKQSLALQQSEKYKKLYLNEDLVENTQNLYESYALDNLIDQQSNQIQNQDKIQVENGISGLDMWNKQRNLKISIKAQNEVIKAINQVQKKQSIQRNQPDIKTPLHLKLLPLSTTNKSQEQSELKIEVKPNTTRANLSKSVIFNPEELLKSSEVLQRFSQYTARLDTYIKTMKCNESMEKLKKQELEQKEREKYKKELEQKRLMYKTEALLNNKVDHTLFKMPYLHEKEANAYYNKFQLTSQDLSPFFKEQKVDVFDYEKEIQRLKDAREKHQSQIKRQFIKKQRQRQKKDQKRRLQQENQFMLQNNSNHSINSSLDNKEDSRGAQFDMLSQHLKDKLVLQNRRFLNKTTIGAFNPNKQFDIKQANMMKILGGVSQNSPIDLTIQSANKSFTSQLQSVKSSQVSKSFDFSKNRKAVKAHPQLQNPEQINILQIVDPIQKSSNQDIESLGKSINFDTEESLINMPALRRNSKLSNSNKISTNFMFQTQNTNNNSTKAANYFINNSFMSGTSAGYTNISNNSFTMSSQNQNLLPSTIQIKNQLSAFYTQLIQETEKAKTSRDKLLMQKIGKSLKYQKKIHNMLQEYIYIYKYDKQENDELMEIVRESMAAVENIKKELIDNDSKIDNDVTAKYEKAFINKLKVWHVNELKQKGFEMQQIDQKAMKFQQKRKYNFTVFNSKNI